MTFFRGSSGVILMTVICSIMISILLGFLVAEKTTRLKLYEKKYEAAIYELEQENISEMEACDFQDGK